MSRRCIVGRTFTALTLLSVAACTDATAPLAPPSAVLGAKVDRGSAVAGVTATYILLTRSDALPGNLSTRVAAAGGRVSSALSGAGIAIVTSDRADFASLAARIDGVASVVRDVPVRLVDPDDGNTPEATAITVNPLNDPLYPLQWWLDAIDAPEAWALGATGDGVRVAVLDGGFYVTHPDLVGQFDLAASRSFIAGQPYTNDVGTFWHGTHVAGIVAAADNNLGVLGVAPHATLIGLKVLHNGTGSLAAVLQAIYYAATPISEGGAGADVINMSLVAVIPEESDDKEERTDVRESLKAFDAATRYAWQQGVTVIASTGNAAIDFADEGKHYAVLPADAQHVIGVSATAPLGWAQGATNFSREASYTNTGKHLVDLSAPGGDGAFLPTTANCTVAGITRPCYVFDYVLSTSRSGYTWASGTSMASPVVAGIAALIIGENGGEMHPAQVAAILRQTAIDVGKPGYDDVYGHGFVNAHLAVERAQ